MINIAEMLKTMPKDTPLYSVDYGDCYLETVWENELIEAYYYNYSDMQKNKIPILFDHYGKPVLNGATVGDSCSLFPSNEMRDWAEFGGESGDAHYHNVADHSVFSTRSCMMNHMAVSMMACCNTF